MKEHEIWVSYIFVFQNSAEEEELKRRRSLGGSD